MADLPRVTEILSPWINKAWFTDESRIRGNMVHHNIANIARGLWVPNLQDGYQGYIDSFRKWFDATVEEVSLVENRLKDPDHGYAGTPDIICRIKGDSLCSLIDYKTGATHSPTWELQMSAYWRLATCNKYKIGRSFSLRLNPEGKMPVIREYLHSEEYFSVFLSALNVHRFLRKE
jgi:hypothetical protein